jgi:hypothetical protein
MSVFSGSASPFRFNWTPPPVATFSSAVKAITVLSGLFPLAEAATTRIETLVPGSQERFMDCRADPTFVALLNSPALMLPMEKLIIATDITPHRDHLDAGGAADVQL